MKLTERNRAAFPESPDVIKMKGKCLSFLQKHDKHHMGRNCLQSMGNQPLGTHANQNTDFELFALANPDFLALFADDSIGYIACRSYPNGNEIKRLSKPVVWEVRNGNVKRPKSAHVADYGMYIEPGDVEYTFLWDDFTVKQWNKMIADGNWCIS